MEDCHKFNEELDEEFDEKEIEVVLDKMEAIGEHIRNVQNNCWKLGRKLIACGKVHLGRNLIKNGQTHDNSKFIGIEFQHLFPGSTILNDVVAHHSSANAHHPEHWGGIKNMPPVYIAEMVCDCCSRSAEMGTNIREWFSTSATEKYRFSMDDETGEKITYFLNLLLTPPFKKS